MPSNTQGSERRKSERFPINATVTIIDTESGHAYSAICCDVSREGLGVQCDKELTPDHTYSLAIQDGDVLFNAQGVIAHQRENAEGGYIIGIKADFEPDLPA